jgi:uncharacterized membrane protein
MRFLRHILVMPGSVRRAFPAHELQAIEKAVAASEERHAGEIRFAVEAALDAPALLRGQSARSRALEVFSDLRVWDTEANNGVLIYLLLADRDVEIVADRGIDRRVGHQGWEAICREMEGHFAAGRFGEGVLAGIARIDAHLARHFPRNAGDADELPNAPATL